MIFTARDHPFCPSSILFLNVVAEILTAESIWITVFFLFWVHKAAKTQTLHWKWGDGPGMTIKLWMTKMDGRDCFAVKAMEYGKYTIRGGKVDMRLYTKEWLVISGLAPDITSVEMEWSILTSSPDPATCDRRWISHQYFGIRCKQTRAVGSSGLIGRWRRDRDITSVEEKGRSFDTYGCILL